MNYLTRSMKKFVHRNDNQERNHKRQIGTRVRFETLTALNDIGIRPHLFISRKGGFDQHFLKLIDTITTSPTEKRIHGGASGMAGIFPLNAITMVSAACSNSMPNTASFEIE